MDRSETPRVFYRDALNAMRTPADQASLVSSCRVQHAAVERGDERAVDTAMGEVTLAMTVFRNLRAHARREVSACLADLDG